MDLPSIRYFVATVEAGSFAGAAAKLGRTQPAVARQVRLLEKELGVALVAPVTPRRLAPTPSGEVLLAGARQVSAVLDEVRRDALDRATEPSGRLCVAVPTAIGVTLMHAVLPDYVARYPKVRVHVLTGYSSTVEDWLREGVADLGFLYGEPRGGELETAPLLELEMFLIAPARGREICFKVPAACSLAQLARLPLVLPGPQQGLRVLVDRILAGAGLGPARAVAEVDNLNLLKLLVKDGIGCSVLGFDGVREEVAAGDIRVVPLARPGLRWRLSLAEQRGRFRSMAAAAMRDMVEDAARRLIASGGIRGRMLAARRA